MNIVSFGGGTNSTAMIIGMYLHKIPVDLILFADTGGEQPHTYEFIRVFNAWLDKHGLPKITPVFYTDKDGNRLNLIKIDGLDTTDEKAIGKRLQDIAKNATTGGVPQRIGELYGFPIKVVSERTLSEGLEFIDNRFHVEGNYKYTYNNGHLAMADTHAAALNFLNALERIPAIIKQYEEKNEVLEREIPQLQEIAGKVWKKEDELKQLKSELAALDRKIQLELAPPTPEITEKEHEGQQVKPEAKGVRNGIRQYPEDTSPQIRNPSESIIANHTITGHPGLYAKEETRSKGLKI